ncbi:hypothetical protein ACFQX7_26195 [Luedemannella flava]
MGAFAAPVAWAAMEFLIARWSPHGAWSSLAYSQADHPLALQVAAVTGVWGVTAQLLLPASAVAALVASREWAAVVPAVVLLVVLATHAYWRTRRHTPGRTLRVGLVAVDGPDLPVPLVEAEGADLVRRYVEGRGAWSNAARRRGPARGGVDHRW